MRRTVLIFALFIMAFPVFAQRLPTVGILLFEPAGGGMSAMEAGEITRVVTAEMSSWGLITVLSGDQARTAEYLVQGQIARQLTQIVVTATTTETRTGRVLNTSREQAESFGAIPVVSFCAQIAGNVPFPNYLLGRWRSNLDMIDGPVTCIMEFRSDRTVIVTQYDTWEHNGTNSLKYQGIGTGTYTYAGYLRRTVTLDRREITTDATVGINLTLEDALPKYTSIRAGGLRVLFNETKTSFDLVYGALPCGNNYSGPSVYPRENVFYTSFTKIQ